ncbi:4-dimethylallyl tryptophan synthase [Daldinia decipiens]|uniref:4-dimethylallyl tryptophan synthase n=1 Tax=Daldinia decipiens TaxID=326647 RepID=UPI0020C1CA3C|nr:4-dimethylallyl tryptophan synthase [Daldinia decipiens]KAI1658829.1 4-dimethylallyl tryptophan synthase [Daldinia decipiens]
MPSLISSTKLENHTYNVLSDVFDFPNDEQRLWWHSTAPMFSNMLQTAGYDTHLQYRHLGHFKKHIIPYLGVYPDNENDRWLSILTRYGTPLELSLNCSDSLVRYTYEPIDEKTGTPEDPFNTHAIWNALRSLKKVQPDLDTEWFTYFKKELTLNSEESAHLMNRGLVQGQIRTQNKLALDLKGNNSMVKTYIYPALKALATGKSIQTLIFDSVGKMAEKFPTIQPALETLESYVKSRTGPSSTVTPRLFSCDLVEPGVSRIKIYLLEMMVSLESMRDLWTLGGRRNDKSTQEGWEMIEELWELLQIPPGLQKYPEPYLPLHTTPCEQLPTMANYTLHHGESMPEPQVYFTVFGMNDMAISQALTTFFERRGWSDMAQKYTDSLRSYYPYDDLETMNWLHAYISFSYRKGKPYLSVYLQTLETGDWPLLHLKSTGATPAQQT